MSYPRYKKLIEEFCHRSGKAQASELLQSGCLIIGHVMFTLMAPQSPQDEKLQVFCDFGPLPSKKKQKVYRRLLEANLLLGSFCNFSINAETGHVMLLYRTALSHVTGASLLANLQLLAAEAVRWRIACSLEDTPSSAHERHAHASLVARLIKQLDAIPCKPRPLSRKRKAP